MRLKRTAVVFASPEGREEFRVRSVEITRDLEHSAVALRFLSHDKSLSIILPFAECAALLQASHRSAIAPEDAASWARRFGPAPLPSTLALLLRLTDATATLESAHGCKEIPIYEAEFTRNLRRHSDRLDLLTRSKTVVSIRFPLHCWLELTHRYHPALLWHRPLHLWVRQTATVRWGPREPAPCCRIRV